MEDIDYVKWYAELLKKDPKIYFARHKKFMDGVMREQSAFAKNMCEGEDFKTCARRYLRKRGLV